MKGAFLFFTNSIFLGVGLAMDAFSVCIVNALTEPNMRRRRQCAVCSVYAAFQFAMPMAGWVCVRTVASIFGAFQKTIPWIALFLLAFIGGKMIFESVFKKEEEGPSHKALTVPVLIAQGIATSIDALSVGFAIADYNLKMAAVSSLVIAVVTFAICLFGLKIGRIAGRRVSSNAGILGGAILIFIGLEIFIRGIFF